MLYIRLGEYTPATSSWPFRGMTSSMRLYYLAISAAVLAVSSCILGAQDIPAANQGPAAASAAQTEDVVKQAAAANKYVFLFFWKENSPQTGKAWGELKPAVAKMADMAVFVSIRITNPAEKQIVDKYGVSRAPMPLVLAIAPSGAVTKSFTKTFDEKELLTALVSPCAERCLRALQSRKLVFVCVVDQANPQDKIPIPKGVEDFKADKKYGAATEIVLLNTRDAKETTFLKELNVGARDAPITVFLAPPGAVIGTFSRGTAKEKFVAQLVAAQSSCCPGGRCGSGGCGPKK
jgi:hypothetical protein